MNGVHDMGGMHGFGPVVREPDEPVFHADWERRAYALVSLVMRAAQINVDEFRHAIEACARGRMSFQELCRLVSRFRLRFDPFLRIVFGIAIVYR